MNLIELHFKEKAKQKQTPWQETTILKRYGLSDLKTVGEPRAIKRNSESNSVEDVCKDTAEIDSIHE